MTIEVSGRGIYFEGKRVAVLTGQAWPSLEERFIATIEACIDEDALSRLPDQDDFAELEGERDVLQARIKGFENGDLKELEKLRQENAELKRRLMRDH